MNNKILFADESSVFGQKWHAIIIDRFLIDQRGRKCRHTLKNILTKTNRQ